MGAAKDEQKHEPPVQQPVGASGAQLDPTGTVVGFDHVQLSIPVDAEEIARGFWVGAMGFVEIPKPVELAGRGGAWFQAGNAQIHVGADPHFAPAQRAHPAIAISGLHAFVVSRELDVEWTTDVPSIVRCQVQDPFGNRIELIDVAASI